MNCNPNGPNRNSTLHTKSLGFIYNLLSNCISFALFVSHFVPLSLNSSFSHHSNPFIKRNSDVVSLRLLPSSSIRIRKQEEFWFWWIFKWSNFFFPLFLLLLAKRTFFFSVYFCFASVLFRLLLFISFRVRFFLYFMDFSSKKIFVSSFFFCEKRFWMRNSFLRQIIHFSRIAASASAKKEIIEIYIMYSRLCDIAGAECFRLWFGKS